MFVADLSRRFGNELYTSAFPIYRPLYSAFKTYADRAERNLLARHLSPGCVVVDAGANIGIYSQFLSRCVGPEGVVHSFEPSPTNFRRLSRAVSTIPNVRANQLALSDKTEESLLYISNDLNVDHRAYPTEGETRKTLAIHSTKLDDYFIPGAHVDLIKMDIQGYELHALRGSERLLKENPKIKLLLELWPFGLRQAGQDWRDLISMLTSCGMLIQQIHKNDLESLPASIVKESPDWYVNLFVERA